MYIKTICETSRCYENRMQFANLLKLFGLVIITSFICNLNVSHAILKCLSPGMFRMSNGATIPGSAYAPEVAVALGVHSSQSQATSPHYKQSLRPSWLNSKGKYYKFNSNLSPFHQQGDYGYVNPLAVK